MKDFKTVKGELLRDYKEINLVMSFSSLRSIILKDIKMINYLKDVKNDDEKLNLILNKFEVVFSKFRTLFEHIAYSKYINFDTKLEANVNLVSYIDKYYTRFLNNDNLNILVDRLSFGFLDIVDRLYDIIETYNEDEVTKMSECITAILKDTSLYMNTIVETKKDLEEAVGKRMYNFIFLNTKALIRTEVFQKLINVEDYYPKCYNIIENIIPLSACISEVISVNILKEVYIEENDVKLSDFYFKDIR